MTLLCTFAENKAPDALQQSTENWNNLSASLMANETQQPTMLSGGEMREYQLQASFAALLQHGHPHICWNTR